ncbi:hypothetical protein KKB68_02275 [Patescibacteria group bacterium]|nr:hypothetical protein [Patescibacteria group bacterium]
MKEMQTKEEETRKRFLERIEGGEGESPTAKTPLPITPKNEIEQPSSPPDILRPLPIKPSLKEKIWVRILIGAIIFTFLSIGLTFAYWFLAIREPSSPPQTPEPPSIEKPTIIIPSSLLSTETTETLEIEAPGEIPEALVQLLKKDFGEEKLTRVLIKNPKENKIIGLKEFFEAFQVKTPEGFYEKLNNDFTLFIYSLDGKNNLGFVAKIEQKQNLANFLKIWEETIEEDTENLFSTLGKEKPALAPYFKQTAYKNITIRYQTFSKDDFGICYSLFDDYLIFTTSLESIKKASESVEDSGLENKIGQLFLIGFEGKTLTPQLEKTLKDLRPGGVVLLSRNIEDKEQLKILIKQLQNLSLENTGLPLFIAVDQEGGRICRLEFAQEKTAQSAIENTGQAYQVGFSRGEELKELGVNLNLAPVLDMAESEDFLFERSFQKGADETGELGKALITGQKQAGVLTAAKHFPGYSGISFNPERSELPILSKIPEISQFKKAIEAKPEMIMASNVIYTTLNKSLPLSFSLEGIQFLKRELGNDYLIISDDLSSPVLKEEFSLEKSITLASNAGIDILLVAGFDDPKDPTSAVEALREAVKDNEVSQKRIEESSLKIIKLKGNLL